MYNVPTLRLVWLTLNRDCNFRCSWCYAASSEYNARDQMSLKFALELLGMMRELEVKKVFLIGGEPTLWSPLLDFNDSATIVGIKTVLVTNGYRFSDDSFWEKYQKHPNTHIGVSFKAFDMKSLSDNVHVGKYGNVTKGLKRVFEYQPDSIASFVYSRPYISHFLDMVKYAIDCGAFGVSVNFCSPTVYRDHVDSQFMVDIDQCLYFVFIDLSFFFF